MTIQHLYPTTRPSLDLNFARTKRLDPRVTFTRGSTATYVGSDGLIKTAAANEARFDHDPTTGESLGLLVEESRTNIQLNSDAPYSSGGSQIVWTTGLTAPDGTSTAVKLAATAVDTYHFVAVGIYPSSMPITTYTYSVYAKSDGSNRFTFKGANLTEVCFDVSTGTVVSGAGGTITPAGNGWYRCSITEANSSAFYQYNIVLNADDESGYAPYLGDGTSGIILWGWQMEAGSFPTSYIPTTSSTVTRSADVASMTGTNFSSWYNQSEGTIMFGSTPLSSTSNNGTNGSTIHISDGSSNNFVNVTNDPLSGGGGSGAVYVSGSPQFSSGLMGSGIKRRFVVLAYQENSFAASAEGLNAVTDTSGTLPVVNRMQIGVYPPTSPDFFANSHIARLTYYPTRLPDAQLQALTL